MTSSTTPTVEPLDSASFVDVEQNLDVERVISAESAARPPSERARPVPPVYHNLSIHVLAILIPSSILGTLARLGLSALATYDGNSIFSLAYAQALGSFIIGVAISQREMIGRFHEPLYIGIATGFCGSLTTFSGWQFEVFSAWLNIPGANRSRFDNFIDGLGVTVYTLSLSLGSLVFGMHLSQYLAKKIIVPPPPSRIVVIGITALSILTYAATLPTYFLLSPRFRHEATAALLFAFPGALTRYLLSINLNPISRSVPLGTLAANSFATALVGIIFVLKSDTPHVVSDNACNLLQGLSDGYCGCLSTVSTFVLEIYTLKKGRGAFYAILSWCVGQILLLVVLGPAIWSGHANKQQTCHFSTG
ncbi:hypothetical protein BDN72DRAFT_831291 [Pluteus cervinus]|uniref:Uncharacterized protein n=1 Tax=Pluteus cervinus TaxID=181527 RepID=A0ACD3BBY4_9AGAR|nr:hypothetical protein BDN72DRAFT_831291 [Pluteus cervinus]